MITVCWKDSLHFAWGKLSNLPEDTSSQHVGWYSHLGNSVDSQNTSKFSFANLTTNTVLI